MASPASVRPDLPGPGQESVWDYPRPPRTEPSDRHVVVRWRGTTVADTRAAVRVLETSHPPTWYVPRADVPTDALRPSSARATVCEWKGVATYWDVVAADGSVCEAAAWSYEEPSAPFRHLAGAVSFLPGRVECEVDGERVRAQEGGFYGGWVTDDVVGPFKGAPGTWGW